jgi:MFS family permease
MIRDHVFVLLLLLHFVALLVFTQFFLALPLDMAAHGVGARRFSTLMGLNCLGVVALQPWIGPRLRGVDRSSLLAISALLFGLGYGLNAFVHTFPLYLLGVGTWTVGEVVGIPSASSMVADLSSPSMRGRYHGAFSMTWALAATASPVLGGEVLQHFGSQPLWVGCGAGAAAVALGHALAGPSRRRAVGRVAGQGIA